MRNKPLLDVKNLSVSFRQKRNAVEAVRDMDYRLEKREILGIIGESGSGKTVSTMSILGLLDENGRVGGGQAFYEGLELLSMDEKDLRKIRGREISYIFQNPQNALNPYARIGKQFEELFRLYEIENGWPLASEILQNVGIENPETLRHMYASQLSGGTCQKVAIAMGVLARPKILIADEPTSAIDASLKRKILILLKKVSIEYGMSIILITHDFDAARFLCDRIIVMYGGMVMEEGTVNQILAKARHPYTMELIRCADSLKEDMGRLYTVEGNPPSPGETGDSCPFFSRCARRKAVCAEGIPELAVEGLRKLRCFNPEGEAKR